MKQRRKARKTITFKGETKSQAEWAKELGINPGTIAWRLRSGLPIHEVLSSRRRTNGRPEDHPMKFIYKILRPFEVKLKTDQGLIRKQFKTLEEAQEFRDNYLSSN